MKQGSRIEGKNCVVYKIISYPFRANILDVYFNLENWYVVLADPTSIWVKAWYLCKGLLEIRSVVSWKIM